MKIKIQRASFLKLFTMASQAAANRDVKPILTNVLLKADKDGACFMATDSELGVRLPVPEIEVQKPGVVVLPVKQMKAILSECKDATLEITVKNNSVTIRGTKSCFTLPTLEADDFPEILGVESENGVTLETEDFLAMVPKTIFATDADSTRYSLGGVFLECDATHLHCVSTDGRRLAHCSCDVQDATSFTANVPVKTLSMVSKVFADEDSLRIVVDGTLVQFSNGGVVVTSRMVEGTYPRWRSIVPKNTGAIDVEFDRSELLTAVRQAAIVATEKQPGVDFVFRVGELELKAEGSETGESSVKLASGYDAKDLTIRLDPKYVVDFLRCLDAKANVTLRLHEDRPVHFLAGGGYEYVVMPISK